MEPRIENGMYIWETKVVIPEFRLYYDESGYALFYTSNPDAKHDENYIVVDKQTYAEGRVDVRVIDGKIVHNVASRVFCKLIPSETEGTLCAEEDVSIVVDEDYQNSTRWRYEVHEIKLD